MYVCAEIDCSAMKRKLKPFLKTKKSKRILQPIQVEYICGHNCQEKTSVTQNMSENIGEVIITLLLPY